MANASAETTLRENHTFVPMAPCKLFGHKVVGLVLAVNLAKKNVPVRVKH